jgi:ATP-dependent DNA helicase RecQ
MDVDAPGIRAVIHRDLPPTVESCLEESGRAGRDGNPAHAIVLAAPSEMTAVAGTTGTRSGALLSGEQCRREILVEALGAEPEVCPGCDVCDGATRAESPVAVDELKTTGRLGVIRRGPWRGASHHAG